MPRKNRDLLDRLTITTPCQADWDSMSGNDRVRFCSHCDSSVHHLSEMTRQEALALVRKSQGHLCVRYYSRPDGTIQLTTQKLHSIKRRASRLAAGAFTATLSLCSTVIAQTPSAIRPSVTDGIRIVNPYDSSRTQRTDGPGAVLLGMIVDPSGAVIPNVNITLVNVQTNHEQTGVSNDEGAFRFQAVPPGRYKLRIEGPPGFASSEIVDIQLSAGEERRIDAALEVAVGTATMGIVVISEPSDVLVKAVSKNDLAAVRELIAMGVDVNVVDKDIDYTPLMQAVDNGNQEIVQALLDAGAEVDAISRSGMTALMMADKDTSVEIVWTLISAGAKVNRRSEQGFSPLTYAAIQGNASILQALIDAGAKLNMKDEEGKTALMWAASLGLVENVRTLLNAGADVYRKNKDGETALSLARGQEHVEVVKLLEAYGAF
ncbi:MAG TPA: ankyrin repeat domain-containing protein [Pyrinomonadaceae bacterium]|nr:ankyrin repeat domain-containing protein [Pyrinomonadaceae bacterium]